MPGGLHIRVALWSAPRLRGCGKQWKDTRPISVSALRRGACPNTFNSRLNNTLSNHASSAPRPRKQGTLHPFSPESQNEKGLSQLGTFHFARSQRRVIRLTRTEKDLKSADYSDYADFF
jgi:hypothetical protein